MRLANRIRALEAAVSDWLVSKVDPDEARRAREELLRYVPPDLRVAVGAVIDADKAAAGALVPWLTQPFAPWAGAPPHGYQLPRALVEWLLDPPRRYWFGHACERCGLETPLLLTWSNDPDPPASIVAHPICPACGGRTSHRATNQPATEGERCD